MLLGHPAFMLFFALAALYAPVAALPSYLPVVSRLGRADHLKLALGLFAYVAIFALVALWVGEYLLELLGLSTAALTMTGGIALSYEGVILMLGLHNTAAEAEERGEALVEEAMHPAGAGPTQPGTAAATAATSAQEHLNWRTVLLVPTTFPLTVGGATFALLVSFSAQAGGVGERGLMTISALAYAVLTAATCFGASLVSRRVSARGLDLLNRIAGILLTAIAVSLLASGGTRLVVDVLHALK